MPVKNCKKDGKNGYKWGDSGYCYTYTTGNESSRKRAKDKAIRQGRAIQVNKSLEDLLTELQELKERLPHISGGYTPYVPTENVE